MDRNEAAIADVLNELEEEVAVVRKFMRGDLPDIVGQEYVAEYVNAIDEKRSPGGRPHPPLKPQSSYPRKKRRDPRNLLLHDTGGMQAGGRHEVTPGAVEIFVDYQDKRGREPQNYHQEGDGVPKRVLLEESDTAAGRIVDRCLRFVRAGKTELAREVRSFFADRTLYGGN